MVNREIAYSFKTLKQAHQFTRECATKGISWASATNLEYLPPSFNLLTDCISPHLHSLYYSSREYYLSSGYIVQSYGSEINYVNLKELL